MQIPGNVRWRAARLNGLLRRRDVTDDAVPQGRGASPRRTGRRIRALLHRGEEGQSIVEFALISPLLLTMMLGMYSMTMALYNYEQLSYSAFNAAQQVGAGRGLLTDPCATVATEVPAGLPTWTASKFTYTLTITDSSGTAHQYGPSGSSFTCTAGAANMAQNEPIKVGVSYTYSWIPAYLLNLSGNLSTTETVLTD